MSLRSNCSTHGLGNQCDFCTSLLFSYEDHPEKGDQKKDEADSQEANGESKKIN